MSASYRWLKNKKMKKLLLFLILLPLFSFGQENSHIQRVGVFLAPPFVIQNEDGTLSGVTIELWNEIAKRNNLFFDYKIYPNNINKLIEEIQADSLDFGMASITISSERERYVDFSQPYYSTYMTVASSMKQKSSVSVIIETFFSWEFAKSVLMFVFVLFVFGAASYFLERRHNEYFNDNIGKGLFDAFYFQVMQFSTVGFGDIYAKSTVGKLLTIFTILLYMLIGAALIGQMSTALTVNHFESGIESIYDLKKLKTGTIKSSTSQTFLDEHNIKYYQYNSVSNGLIAIESEELDALMYDRPVLKYYLNGMQNDEINLLDEDFGAQQHYGIMMKHRNPLKEKINIDLLHITETDSWKEVLNKYGIN